MPHLSLDDLISEGRVGLMDAIARYLPNPSVAFMTFAYRRINGAIIDYLRSQDYIGRIYRKRGKEIAQTADILEKELQRAATPNEIADRMGLSMDDVQGVLDYLNLTTIPLDKSQHWEDDDIKGPRPILDDSESALDLLVRKERAARLHEAMENLSPRQQLILKAHYVDELSFREIGESLGLPVTESRIVQIHVQALSKLKSHLRRL